MIFNCRICIHQMSIEMRVLLSANLGRPRSFLMMKWNKSSLMTTCLKTAAEVVHRWCMYPTEIVNYRCWFTWLVLPSHTCEFWMKWNLTVTLRETNISHLKYGSWKTTPFLLAWVHLTFRECTPRISPRYKSRPGPSKGCQLNPNGWWIDTL